MEELFY